MVKRAVFVGAFALAAAIVPALVATATPPYGSCSEAHADGRFDITAEQSGYSAGLDSDSDGIACES